MFEWAPPLPHRFLPAQGCLQGAVVWCPSKEQPRGLSPCSGCSSAACTLQVCTLCFDPSGAADGVLGRRKRRRKDRTCRVPQALTQNWLHLPCFLRNRGRRQRCDKLKKRHFSNLYIPYKQRLSLKTKQKAARARPCFPAQSSYCVCAWCCPNATS